MSEGKSLEVYCCNESVYVSKLCVGATTDRASWNGMSAEGLCK